MLVIWEQLFQAFLAFWPLMRLHSDGSCGWEHLKGFFTHMPGARSGRPEQLGDGSPVAPWAFSLCEQAFRVISQRGPSGSLDFLLVGSGLHSLCPKGGPGGSHIAIFGPVSEVMQRHLCTLLVEAGATVTLDGREGNTDPIC